MEEIRKTKAEIERLKAEAESIHSESLNMIQELKQRLNKRTVDDDIRRVVAAGQVLFNNLKVNGYES